MPDIKAGSRWVMRIGRHKGSVAEVVRTNDMSVFLYDLGGGAATGNQKVDQSAVHTLSRELFLRRYAPEGMLETNGTGRAFRRVAVPKPKPAATPPAGQPALGLIEPHGAPLNIEILDVTPDQAAAWLANGGLNRHLDPRRVNRLAIAIRRGEWQLTGEAIKLDANGRVRDGQNRLAAVVAAGLSIKTLVVRGVDEAAFDVMDTGRSRAAADVFSIRGIPSPIGMASAVRALISIERFGMPNPGSDEGRAAATTPASLGYLAAHPDVYEGFHLADRLRKEFTGGIGLWAAMFTLFWRVDQAAAAEFNEQLWSGADLKPRSAALVLRRQLSKSRQQPALTGARRDELAVIIAKAWNAYRADAEVSISFRARDGEQMPELV